MQTNSDASSEPDSFFWRYKWYFALLISLLVGGVIVASVELIDPHSLVRNGDKHGTSGEPTNNSTPPPDNGDGSKSTPAPTPAVAAPTPAVPAPTPAVAAPTPAVPAPTPAVPAPTPAAPTSAAALPKGAFNSCGAGKRVALTFDDGPSVEHTRQVLAELRSAGLAGKATFMISPASRGRQPVLEQCDILKEILADGHEIQSHSFTHKDMVLEKDANLVEELNEVQSWVRDFCKVQVTGDNLQLFRPPFGSFSMPLRLIAREQGYAVITWNIDSLDWASSSKSEVYDRVKNLVHDQQGLGQESFLMLFHDTHYFEGLYQQVKNLFDDSYEFVKASDCYRACKTEFYASDPGYSIWQY